MPLALPWAPSSGGGSTIGRGSSTGSGSSSTESSSSAATASSTGGSTFFASLSRTALFLWGMMLKRPSRYVRQLVLDRGACVLTSCVTCLASHQVVPTVTQFVQLRCGDCTFSQHVDQSVGPQSRRLPSSVHSPNGTTSRSALGGSTAWHGPTYVGLRVCSREYELTNNCALF
jgi:hypothetical protein